MANELVSIFDDMFNNKHSFVGFNDFFNDLSMFDSMLDESGIKDSYPAYSIYTRAVNVAGDGEKEMTIDHTFVDVACAGFSKDEINADYNDTTHVLTVKGSKKVSEDKVKYSYQGIAMRKFKRMWKLDSNLKFVKAKYEDGVLSIEFEPEMKEKEKIKSLPID